MYTWGYIKSASLAKLDLEENEANIQNLLNRFPVYANEVITQVCSAIKPKYTFAEFEVTTELVGKSLKMPKDFVSFGDDVCYGLISYDNKIKRFALSDCHFTYQGYDEVVFFVTGKFYISYNARWYDFDNDELDNNTELDIPYDILDCIPSYIASQCYKIDDEYKSSVYRNEYEMMLARIDNTNYKNTKTIFVGGDEW